MQDVPAAAVAALCAADLESEGGAAAFDCCQQPIDQWRARLAKAMPSAGLCGAGGG